MTIETKTIEIDPGHDEIPCNCCPESIKLGMNCYLNIHARIPHGDERLVVLLYHNWITPDTAYVVFGTTYRILGLYPPNLLLKLLRWANEDEKSQK